MILCVGGELKRKREKRSTDRKKGRKRQGKKERENVL